MPIRDWRPADVKRRAVLLLLNDPAWRGRSTAAIARQARVSQHLVARIRLELSGGSPPAERAYTRNGVICTMQTGGIGRGARAPARRREPAPELAGAAATAPVPLRAPFPYPGGKRRAAELVWGRLGDVSNYVEPFGGSLAVLLLRPTAPRVETVNDADCHIANFWRATQHDPGAVAEYADGPVIEADLHARHRWLVYSDDAAAFRRRMKSDPHFYDVKIAGWWCWGLCCWIKDGWCTPAGVSHAKRPQLSGQDGYAYAAGVLGRPELGTCAERRAWLLEWFAQLRDRLRNVRVCCGDWSRVCSSDSVLTRLGITGVFLDPPYSAEAGRRPGIYATDDLTVAHAVRAWCLEWGGRPKMRICLAGYAGEGHEGLEAHGWEAVAWTCQDGGGKRRANRWRERLWFSPGCLPGT